MIRHRHGAARPLALAHAPVLREGAGAGDGRLVGAGVGAEGVGAAVGLDGALVGGAAAGAGVVGAVGLDDVVFGLRGVDPAVDGQVRARARGGVGGGVGDVAGGACGPAEARIDVNQSVRKMRGFTGRCLPTTKSPGLFQLAL